MHRMVNQLLDTQVLGCRDRYHRHSQKVLHGVHIHRSSVGAQLVHHIKGYNHGDIELQELQCQEQVSFYICGIYDVYDSLGLFVQNKVTRHQLLAAVGGHGVDAGKVGDQCVWMSFYNPVLPVHCNAREVAHMLVHSCKLVEKGGLTAVLVAHQGKCQKCSVGQGISCSFGVETSFLAQTGVWCPFAGCCVAWLFSRFFFRLDLGPVIRGYQDVLRLCKAQGQLISIYLYLDGITHGGELDYSY